MLAMTVVKQQRFFYDIINTYKRFTDDEMSCFIHEIKNLPKLKQKEKEGLIECFGCLQRLYDKAKASCMEVFAARDDALRNEHLGHFVRIFGQVFLFLRGHSTELADKFCDTLPWGIPRISVNKIVDSETNKIEIDYMHWTFDLNDLFLDYLDLPGDIKLEANVDTLCELDGYDYVQSLSQQAELMAE